MSTEPAPHDCPNGHPLIANTCLVGWEVCACDGTTNGGHRTFYCRRCGETLRIPPCLQSLPQTDRWAGA